MARAATSRAAQAANRQALRDAAAHMAAVLTAAYGRGATSSVLEKVGRMVTNDLKRLLAEPGSGRIYKVGVSPTKSDVKAGRKFRSHQASSPNRPPASDTGHLRRSYTYAVTLDGKAVEIGTQVLYAPYLEFGTRKMKPRPHLRVAINRQRQAIATTMKRDIERRLRQEAK